MEDPNETRHIIKSIQKSADFRRNGGVKKYVMPSEQNYLNKQQSHVIALAWDRMHEGNVVLCSSLPTY